MKLGIIKLALGLLPTIKGAVFSNGKFEPKRAGMLLAGSVLLGVSVHFLGAENTAFVVDQLDDVSDIIGYE